MASGVRTALRGRGRGPRRCSVRDEGAAGPGAEPQGHTQPSRNQNGPGKRPAAQPYAGRASRGEPFVAGIEAFVQGMFRVWFFNGCRSFPRNAARCRSPGFLPEEKMSTAELEPCEPCRGGASSARPEGNWGPGPGARSGRGTRGPPGPSRSSLAPRSCGPGPGGSGAEPGSGSRGDPGYPLVSADLRASLAPLGWPRSPFGRRDRAAVVSAAVKPPNFGGAEVGTHFPGAACSGSHTC